MAKSKEDITYGTSQARLSEDESVRVAYVHGTPLEGGKMGDYAPDETVRMAYTKKFNIYLIHINLHDKLYNN